MAARERGIALAKQGRFPEALASLATENIGEDDAEGLNTRGMVLTALERLDEALECFERALAVRPDFADAINNCGTVHARRGDFAAARGCYERSLALAPDQVHASYNLSTTLLALGEWSRGFREFEIRWKLFPHEAVRRNCLAPAWLGEFDVSGKTLLLHHEQGYGDAIQFSRYAPLVAQRAARVIIAVPRALRKLMDTLGSGVEVVADGDPMPAHDYCCGLMSLPAVFDTTPENVPASVPYLKADLAAVNDWRRRLGAPSGARLGLVWSGRRYPPINRPRDIPLETIRPLLGVDAEFVSLQQGLTQQERELLGHYSNVTLHGEGLTDFADSAALLENLDLLITVDTAIAHLAGALGKPVWLMNRFASCWRWLLKRTDSPWYPTMRLFRQHSLGDWEGVVGSPEGGHRTRRQAPDAAVGHCSQATDAVDPKAEATADPPHLGAWAQPRTPGAAAPHRFETEGARPCGRHCRARPGFCCACSIADRHLLRSGALSGARASLSPSGRGLLRYPARPGLGRFSDPAGPDGRLEQSLSNVPAGPHRRRLLAHGGPCRPHHESSDSPGSETGLSCHPPHRPCHPSLASPGQLPSRRLPRRPWCSRTQIA